jgi:PAS domain S-box-containing protein
MGNKVKEDAVNVLLVDDQPGKLLSYEVMLEELGENLVPASSAKEALAYLLKAEVAVILVDVCMPELDGFELARLIREHPRFQKTPIIFISAIHLTESDFLRGYQAGAVDYLSVPVVPELLRAKVRVFAELFRKTRELQELNNELERRVLERTEALRASTDQLLQSEQGRTMALAAGHMGSWTYDLGTDSWFGDEGQSRIFGAEREKFLADRATVRRFICEDDIASLRTVIEGLSRDANNFETELRIVRENGDIRWCRVAAAAMFDANDQMVRLNGVTTDITERKQAESKQALLAREVDHRAKNTLAIVQAIVRMARRDDVHEFAASVQGRIKALAVAHELLSQSRWEGAEMLRLVLEEVAPYQADGQQRVTAIGPSLLVSPENAQTIAMALHELATNAAKYGALSSPAGKVDVSWSSFEGRLTINWNEFGGPAVRPPVRTGFGTKIITASFADPRKGSAHFDWQPLGLSCTLEINTQAHGVEPALVSEPDRADEREPGRGKILLVEDEVIVGLFMEDLLKESGYEPSEPHRTLADAIAAADAERFDAAVLDMNLNGEQVYPLADRLIEQSVPFVFVTGYAAAVVAERFSHIPLLQKPIEPQMLFALLDRLTNNSIAAKIGSGRRLTA